MSASDIDGVTFSHLRQISDDRGSVLHMLRCDDPEFIHFGECYFSEVLPGAIKAWKRHRFQAQNLAVPFGRIRLVIFDSREFSSSNGRLLILELGRPDAYLRLHIPPGLWYGFTCVSDTVAIMANCPDLPHDPSESDVLPTNSFIPYKWGIEINEIGSG